TRSSYKATRRSSPARTFTCTATTRRQIGRRIAPTTERSVAQKEAAMMRSMDRSFRVTAARGVHRRRLIALAAAAAAAFCSAALARADETCMSPYMPKITGREDYVYIWTLGIDGVGDGSDKLVTIGANPANAATYGKVVSSVSVGGRHEAHHAGFSDDRRHLWAGGLDDSTMWIFDVAGDPAHPKIARTLDGFVKESGGVIGPHTFFALPGRMLITGLSNDKDKGGKTALVEYNNEGAFVQTLWLPEGAEYGYDARVQPRLNRMLTSSFTGWNNYMNELGKVMADPEAMKRFGNTMVVWDFHARKPIQ